MYLDLMSQPPAFHSDESPPAFHSDESALADSQVYLGPMSQPPAFHCDESAFGAQPSVSWSDESPPAFRADDSPPVPSIKTVGTIAQRQFATDRSKRNMKTYQISGDRVVVVKKNLVTIKQKDSDKSIEFTPSRLALCTFVTKILY